MAEIYHDLEELRFYPLYQQRKSRPVGKHVLKYFSFAKRTLNSLAQAITFLPRRLLTKSGHFTPLRRY